ncbi:hypothetical protein V6N12_017628 [Hibiscus sabdariffa]|uniref:Uncharacterized protein n=1 Tax=Hibiscus sabdariffa TaxID=183260 RepID=A0ABR2CG21_9ROSI
MNMNGTCWKSCVLLLNVKSFVVLFALSKSIPSPFSLLVSLSSAEKGSLPVPQIHQAPTRETIAILQV